MSSFVEVPTPGAVLWFGAAGNPLVVVLHDWFGRHSAVQRIGRGLAARGFRVAVPDFYDGQATLDSTSAEELMSAVPPLRALDTIEAIIAEARADGSRRIATVGFSFGGWLALLHAGSGTTDAAVVYYSSIAGSEHGIIPCPLLLHWAEFDEFVDHDEAESLASRLRAHGTPFTQHRYLGTAHPFSNAEIEGLYDADATALALERTARFLEEHLAN